MECVGASSPVCKFFIFRNSQYFVIIQFVVDIRVIFSFKFECGRKFIECLSNVKIVIRLSDRVPDGRNMLVLLEVTPGAKILTTAFD